MKRSTIWYRVAERVASALDPRIAESNMYLCDALQNVLWEAKQDDEGEFEALRAELFDVFAPGEYTFNGIWGDYYEPTARFSAYKPVSPERRAEMLGERVIGALLMRVMALDEEAAARDNLREAA